MHGYEIIRTLEQKSHGLWRPSPGSVYPILQYLEEQDLVKSADENGKKVYTLTEHGRQYIEKNTPHHGWEQHARAGRHFREMRTVVQDMIHMMREIGVHGTNQQQEQARALLQEMRDRLRDILNHTHDNQDTK